MDWEKLLRYGVVLKYAIGINVSRSLIAWENMETVLYVCRNNFRSNLNLRI